MKKYLFPLLAVLALPAFAADIEFTNLSKKEVEDVTTEFAVNFSHTTVAAPETEGLWGVEVGVLAGQTGTPKLKDAVDASGNNGSDFKSVYHGGAFARAHFPFDLFAEVSVLPRTRISTVDVDAKTLGLGWNAGAFFNLPLDLAIGFNASKSTVDFKQDIMTIPSKINVDSQTRIFWVGVSKVFPIVTPYAKFGAAKQDSDLKVDGTGTIFGYTTSQKDSASKSGSYLALGANLQLAFLKLGFEWSQTMEVRRATGKLSIDF